MASNRNFRTRAPQERDRTAPPLARMGIEDPDQPPIAFAIDFEATDPESHLVLPGAPEIRFRATGGCNQLIGGYERKDARFTFEAIASTRMACPPPLDTAERSLHAVIEANRTARHAGQVMVFEDGQGQPIADFTAVYLR